MLALNFALVPRQHRALLWTIVCLLLSTFLEAHRVYPYRELASESLCWAILYVVTSLSCWQCDYRGAGERSPQEEHAVVALKDDQIKRVVASSGEGQASERNTSEVELLLAGAVVFSSACRQLASVNWTFPLMTFLLDYCRNSSSTSCPQIPLPEWRSKSWKPSSTALAVAVLSSAALLPVLPSVHSVALCGCFMLGQWAIYNGISKVWKERSFGPPVLEKNIGDLRPIRSIAGFALVGSLLLNVMFTTTLDVRVLLGGLLKAAWWIVILQLVTLDTTFSIAMKASTFGTALTFVQNNHRPLLALPAALVAAYSLYLISPITRKGSLSSGKPLILGLFMLFSIEFLSFTRVDLSRGHWSLPSYLPISGSPDHPIEALIVEGKARYSTILRSQSQTLGDAVNEYQRRYGRPPPRGFDSWFHIAKSQGLIIMDDYDTLMGALETYWRFLPSTLRRNIEGAATHLDLANDLILRDGIMETTRAPEFFLFTEMVKETAAYVRILPNISVPVLLNRLDDIDLARVVLPHDEVGSAENTETASKPWDFEWLDLYAQFTWDTITVSCSPESPARQDRKKSGHASGLPFLADVPGSKNVCVHPELRHQHGAWSPSRRHYISHKAVPIFSSSKTSLNGDILFPSPYYANDYRRAGANESKAWDEKSNDLYWAGQTTGMRVFKASKWPWRNITSHRHRFVEFVNDIGTPRNVTLLDKASNGRWRPYESPMASQSHLYDVSFSGLSQCDDEYQCADMKTHFNITGGHSSEEHKNHRFVFDLDGNAFSGRFYRLLESNATVLKQTIFQEWHDDSLIPWYHYVPVSMGMEELPEIMRYMAETEQGQQRAREIAHQAAEWAKIALRREDVGAVFVRVLLEYARLVDDDRDNISCC